MSNAALEPDEDILSNPKRYAIAQFKNRPLSKKQQKFEQEATEVCAAVCVSRSHKYRVRAQSRVLTPSTGCDHAFE